MALHSPGGDLCGRVPLRGRRGRGGLGSAGASGGCGGLVGWRLHVAAVVVDGAVLAVAREAEGARRGQPEAERLPRVPRALLRASDELPQLEPGLLREVFSPADYPLLQSLYLNIDFRPIANDIVHRRQSGEFLQCF